MNELRLAGKLRVQFKDGRWKKFRTSIAQKLRDDLIDYAAANSALAQKVLPANEQDFVSATSVANVSQNEHINIQLDLALCSMWTAV